MSRAKIEKLKKQFWDKYTQEENKMGDRYYITGVQLGLLVAHENELIRQQIVENIINKQFICNKAGFEELLNMFSSQNLNQVNEGVKG